MSEEPAQEMLHNTSGSVKCSAKKWCNLHQKEVNPIQSFSWTGEGTVKDLRGVRPNKNKYISLSSIYTSHAYTHTRARRAYAYEGGVRNLFVQIWLRVIELVAHQANCSGLYKFSRYFFTF